MPNAPAISSRDPLVEIGDQRVIDEVICGNREMFEVLVRRYNQQLFRVGFTYLRQREPVEDAMQNAYLKAFVHLRRFQRQASFSTWITRIMINECLMMRRRRRLTAEETLEAEPASDETSAPQGAAHLTLKEMKNLLEKSIAGLPRKFRTVYVLREVQQMTTAEAAACLGLSTANVKVSLHRARELLKTELLKSAAGLELFPYRAQFCDPLTARVMGAILAVA
jgi:RNA polymerase sigma-70 factor (ECF subfamily)